MLLKSLLKASAVILVMPSNVNAANWAEILFGRLDNCFPSPQRLYLDIEKKEFFEENLPINLKRILNPKKAKINAQCGREVTDNLATFETKGNFLGNFYRAIKIPVSGHCDCFTCITYVLNFEDSAENLKAKLFLTTGINLKIWPDEDIENDTEPGLDENGEDKAVAVSAYIGRDGKRSSLICDLTW